MKSNGIANNNVIDTFYEYDDNGKLVHEKTGMYGDDQYNEVWYEYNEHGQLVKEKGMHKLFRLDVMESYEITFKYDDNNNIIYREDIYDGARIHKFFYKYDDNNNLVYKKSINGDILNEEWYEYNQNNKIAKYRDSDGVADVFEYDDNGKLVHKQMIKPNIYN